MPQAVFVIILGVFGFLNCFFGYRIFKALLPVWGLLIGASLGSELVQELTGTDSQVAIIVAAVAGAILGSVLFSTIYFLGVFVVGGSFAMMLARTAFSIDNSELNLLVILLAGLVGGLGALLAQKIIIILATAFGGAAAIFTCVFAILEYEPITDFYTDPAVLEQWFLPTIGATFTLAVVGIVVQFFATSDMGRRNS